jgi:hypothetical protein
MQCYACDHDATRQCRRCSRLYCEDHGADVCNECLAPGSGLPTLLAYRGSLLALLAGVAIGIWLLVRPPGDGESTVSLLPASPTGAPEVTRTTVASPGSGTRTPVPRSPTAPASPSPAATPSPTPAPAAREYVVQEGDSLVGIAEQFAPPGVSPIDYARRIAELNGIDFDNPVINPGDVLRLPE